MFTTDSLLLPIVYTEIVYDALAVVERVISKMNTLDLIFSHQAGAQLDKADKYIFFEHFLSTTE